ncbi:hypothetical protein ETAE_1392 [Edwardsiella piscicida]|uniref:Uncharacterized protein n=1 Tax=Edwardsiella piscicida TaxID=1263550 RepID=A0AAU8P6L3_EDWPI|nr:hypothetical protein ETAE_1392 [Edwardsiella tarda EIB202]
MYFLFCEFDHLSTLIITYMIAIILMTIKSCAINFIFFKLRPSVFPKVLLHM